MTEKNTFPIAELQQKAAGGDAQAQFDLAYCYACGTDVEQDKEQSLTWLTKAAEQGLVNAQLLLGLYYSQWGHYDGLLTAYESVISFYVQLGYPKKQGYVDPRDPHSSVNGAIFSRR